MDWLNEFQSISGMDRVIADAAQRLMRGPVVFKSPYWDRGVVIETLDDYRAWIRTVEQLNNEPEGDRRALEIWESEKNLKCVETEGEIITLL